MDPGLWGVVTRGRSLLQHYLPLWLSGGQFCPPVLAPSRFQSWGPTARRSKTASCLTRSQACSANGARTANGSGFSLTLPEPLPPSTDWPRWVLWGRESQSQKDRRRETARHGQVINSQNVSLPSYVIHFCAMSVSSRLSPEASVQWGPCALCTGKGKPAPWT